jgi:sulfite exporter TauE/SafE
VSLAFFHTVIGIDHYIPFIALSQANAWSVKKTMLIVLVCGIGHVLASIVLGFVGIALSTAVTSLEGIESIRGEIATYFLIAFGIAYTIFGLRSAIKNKTHRHVASDGRAIMHAHSKNDDSHEHIAQSNKKSLNVFWGLFILLILGPCEPLIPILMYPAATHNTWALISVTVSFAACTIVTMLAATFLGLKGIRLIKLDKLERYAHALAGSAVLVCGIAVLVLPI